MQEDIIKQKNKEIIIRKILKRLFFIVLFISIFVAFIPFLFDRYFYIFIKNKNTFPYESVLIDKGLIKANTNPLIDLFEGDNVEVSEIPEGKRLVIPTIAIDLPIYEGDDESVLMNGIWMKPKSVHPMEGGNVVLSGHRLVLHGLKNFLPEHAFKSLYNLDKVEVGDYIIIYWDKVEYPYQITRIFEVTPDETYIEDQTGEDILTLYTCTPVYTSKRRLVVIAKKIE